MHGWRSPRTRRRLMWVCVTGAAAAGVALAVVLLPQAHRQPEVFRNVPADVPAAQPRSVKPTAELRRRLIGVTAEFVRTAVRRKQVDASWVLVHPVLKQGLSRREWRTGAIPVVPFPAAGIVEWHLDWSYANDVAADVVLEPERNSGLYRKSFTIEFKRVPAAKADRWLVYSWVPNGVSDALVQDEHRAGVEAALARVRGHNGVPVEWVLLPICFFGGVFLLPLFLVLNERRRLRRAEKAHRDALERRYSSSSRPS